MAQNEESRSGEDLLASTYVFPQQELDALLPFDTEDLFTDDTGTNVEPPQQHDLTAMSSSKTHQSVPLPLMQQFPVYHTPNMAMGPSFHPSIGWYYPAPVPMPYASTGVMNSVMTSGSLTPMSQPSSALQQLPPNLQGPLLKPHLGETRLVDSSSSSTPDQQTLQLPSQSSSSSAPRAQRRSIKKECIIKNCVCTKEATMKIRRPKNAFILYRSHHAKDIVSEAGSQSCLTVSRKAGEMWRAESKAVKAKFYALAAEEKRIHAETYPDYRYNPGNFHAARFGDKNCTCGAYKINKEALMRRLEKEDEDMDHGPAAPAVDDEPRPTRKRKAPASNWDDLPVYISELGYTLSPEEAAWYREARTQIAQDPTQIEEGASSKRQLRSVDTSVSLGDQSNFTDPSDVEDSIQTGTGRVAPTTQLSNDQVSGDATLTSLPARRSSRGLSRPLSPLAASLPNMIEGSTEYDWEALFGEALDPDDIMAGFTDIEADFHHSRRHSSSRKFSDGANGKNPSRRSKRIERRRSSARSNIEAEPSVRRSPRNH